jgi:UTP--glucose-1-phosphate uridylyltransferase
MSLAVFPVAGKGSRLLPLTYSVSKEMLPLAGRPLIDYAILAALHAGAKKLVFVIHPSKQDLWHYCQKATNPYLQQLIAPFGDIDIFITEQAEQKGLGHAVYQAKDYITDTQPIIVMAPDDVMYHRCLNMSDHPMADMRLAYDKLGRLCNMALVEKVPSDKTHLYGILELAQEQPYEKEGILHAIGLTEKPKAEEAPSPYAIIAQYLLHYDIMHYLAKTKADHKGEIQLTDAMHAMLPQYDFYGYHSHNTIRYDCGSINGLHNANMALYR